jgi:hypothetical protein
MPMPVSLTEKRSLHRPSLRSSAATARTTSPTSVNLTAFASRLPSACRSHVESPRIAARHVLVEQAAELDLLLGGPDGDQAERALGALAHLEGLLLEVELARLDLREVEDLVDDPKQRVAARPDHLYEVALLTGQLGVQQQPAHADHRVHRRPDLVAHRREEQALGVSCRLGLLTRPLNLGDVVVEHQVASALGIDYQRNHQDLDVHERPVLAGAPGDAVRETLRLGLPADLPAFPEEGLG